jgi:hypothetical protein
LASHKDLARELRALEMRVTKKFAAQDETLLISLDKLFDLWVEHYDKLSDQARRRLPLRPIQFLAPGG